MKLYYRDSRVTVRQFFFSALGKSGISQQCQCFYIASKFNACVVFNVLFWCSVRVSSFNYLLGQL